MAKQRMINTKIWSDNYFEELDPTEKLLFLYFLTNIYTNICGIYEIPLKIIAVETGIDKEMVKKILQRFESDKKIFYIGGYIYIKNFIKNQNVNPSVEKGVKRELNEIPQFITDKIQAVTACDSLGQDGLLNLTKLNLTKLNLTKPNVNEGGGKNNSVKNNFSPTQEIPAILKQSIGEFEDMRKKIKKPMTNRAKQMLLKKINELGSTDSEKIMILEQSIFHCRQGVYPLKDEFKLNDPMVFRKYMEEGKSEYLKKMLGMERFTESKRFYLTTLK